MADQSISTMDIESLTAEQWEALKRDGTITIGGKTFEPRMGFDVVLIKQDGTRIKISDHKEG